MERVKHGDGLDLQPGSKPYRDGMDAMTIAEAAEATGFTASALRFYETAGLIRPGRTGAGYRTFGEDDLFTLRFIGRAKRLGLSLEEIADLVPLLDDERCGEVQEQLRALVGEKIADAQQRAVDLISFLGQLQRMVRWLSGPPTAGGCDDRCGCMAEIAGAADEPVAVALVSGGAPIVCTLAPEAVDERMAAWQAVTGSVRARQPIEDGVRVRLPRDTDLVALAGLVASEQTCCSFFTFAITVTADAVHLDVRAPGDGQPLVHALVGPAT
jgi:MerR family copper efflux transcriptional regulator